MLQCVIRCDTRRAVVYKRFCYSKISFRALRGAAFALSSALVCLSAIITVRAETTSAVPYSDKTEGVSQQRATVQGTPASTTEPTAGFGFYSYSYLYAPNSGRDANFFSLTGFYKGQTSGPTFQAKGNFEGVAVVKPSTTWTIEAPEAYIGTSNELSETVQVKVGRELHHFSHLDEEFQMGIWQPRFRWDYVHPETVGLAGMHVDVETKGFQFTAMGSPIYIPDRGVPIDFKNNGIYSIDPYFNSPATTIMYQGVATPVSYSLDRPTTSELLFHPGASALARVGESQGPWASAGYAFQPMNQLLYSYSWYDSVAVNNQGGQATLYPRVAYHQLMSFESGFEAKSVGAWISELEDRPIDHPTLGDDTQTVISSHAVGPSFEYRFGDGKYAQSTKIRLSGMKQWGGNAPDSGADTTGSGSVFENRYFSQTSAIFYVESPLGMLGFQKASMSYRLLDDIEHQGTIQSTDLYYNFSRGFIVNVGADILSSAEDTSAPDPISEYRADDRVRLGVSYVF
jgi:hypothetical protein